MNEFKSLDQLIKNKKAEISKYTKMKKKELDPLIKRKEELRKILYDHMVKYDLQVYNGIKIEMVTLKAPRKKVDKEVYMEKLREMGIRNPEEVIEELGL